MYCHFYIVPFYGTESEKNDKSLGPVTKPIQQGPKEEIGRIIRYPNPYP